MRVICLSSKISGRAPHSKAKNLKIDPEEAKAKAENGDGAALDIKSDPQIQSELSSDRPPPLTVDDEVDVEDGFLEDEAQELTRAFASEARVAFRCVCGQDILLAQGGDGECPKCGREISLGRMSVAHTISFCGDLDSGTSFQLAEGPDRAGEALGHFRLLSKLGYGGMGEVYRALDESLQRFVAVKVLRGIDAEDEKKAKHVTRLLDEAVAQARLNHPNVVTIYYVGRAGEEPFFAMELLPGPTLGHLLEDGPLPYEDVVRYARQVCSALAQASRLGLVHGDIKPGNLILADGSNIKLSDFGLAKTEATHNPKVISGTISYMAPELAQGVSPSQHSDMYSLGVTIFELTFGHRPYEVTGSTLKEQVLNQKDAHIEFPDKWPQSVPERFREIIEKLLSKDPEDRYTDFEVLDKVLAENEPVGFTPASLAVRAIALAIDYAVLGLGLVPLFFLVREIDQGNVPMKFRWLTLAAPLIPLLATFIERRSYRTLGRYLLQLRLVDRLGLRLERKQRFWRSFFRYSPIWVACFTLIFTAFHLEIPVAFISPVDEFLMLINMIPALGSQKLALHDRIVGSRIVLDTAE